VAAAVSAADSTSVAVPALLDGMRVDRAVSLLTGVSRATAAALVAAGRVQVDGVVPATRGTPLTAGSVLCVDLPEDAGAGLGPEPDVEVPVVHADAELIVVDKPAGLVVHPGAGRTTGTLAGGLLARFPDLGALATSGAGDPRRPGIVHRLDRGTSGLIVVARTESSYRSLVDQLAARTVARRYAALVAGHLVEDRGVVEAPIGRSSRSPTRMAVAAHGRPARTRYRVLARLDSPAPATLLAVALETGRTHQIRVHLGAIGHPVIGDDRYGRPPSSPALPAGRLFLHAYGLDLDHPGTGRRVGWRSALPDDLASFVAGTPALPDEV
jgi:23S rRNA pseudouridine1911/1915/1917 synthase